MMSPAEEEQLRATATACAVDTVDATTGGSAGEVQLTPAKERAGEGAKPTAGAQQSDRAGVAARLRREATAWLSDRRTERSARSALLTLVIYSSAYYGEVRRTDGRPAAALSQ